MNDTSPEIADKWRGNFATLSGEDKIKMACSMFEFARDIVIESERSKNPNLTEQELSELILGRFYKKEIESLITRRRNR